MKKNRRVKTMAIVVLFMTIVGLTMGFFAFSSTLIVEPMANVLPNEGKFKLVLYGYDYLKNSDLQNFDELSTTVSDPFRIIGAEGAHQAKIDNSLFSISNLHAKFTGPGQSVSYAFMMRNEGSVDVYLNSIEFDTILNGNLKKQCVNSNGVFNESINKVCDDIRLSVEIKGNEYYDTNNFSGNNIKIAKDEFIEFFVHIDYRQNGDIGYEYLFVDFGDILLNFSLIES